MLDILAYCSDVRVWTPGVRYAAELAAKLGGTLTGIHVSPPWPTSEPRGAPPSLMAELVAHAQEAVYTAMEANTRFCTWAAGLGVGSTKWHVALGDAADVLSVAANWSHVTVIDRRISDREDTTRLIYETLLSGFVCLVVPDNGYALARVQRVAVAYDGSSACIRALHAAVPLLQRAIHVVLIECDLAKDAREGAPRPPFDPRQYLLDRGVDVDVEQPDGDASACAQAILDAASRNRADLLVAGAPGKRHFGECRLDETPRLLLNYTGIPVLLAR